jgi:hypothetical protein
MKKIINKKIMLGFFVFGLFLINTNNSSAHTTYTYHNEGINYVQQYVAVVPTHNYDVNALPMCDSTYRLICPYNVYCRNINGMTAFACPANYANQPSNTNYNYNNNNNYSNNNSYIYSNNTGYINYSNQNYTFTNAYYTNPAYRPHYEIVPTYNQANNYYHAYYSY